MNYFKISKNIYIFFQLGTLADCLSFLCWFLLDLVSTQFDATKQNSSDRNGLHLVESLLKGAP